MSTGVRLFHSSKSLMNYVLVKPTEDKVYLYQLEKDGSIDQNAKPLMRKTYTEHHIRRKAFFPYSTSFWGDYCRYNYWSSKVPRQNSNSEGSLLRTFSIRNREGDFGNVLRIRGCVDNDGKVNDVKKLNFPLSEYHILQYNIPNLTKIYLLKIFSLQKAFSSFIEKTPIRDKFYISPEERETLNRLDAEYKVPPFKVTDKIKASMETLAKKHKIKIVV